METLNLAAILITLSALFSYINHRFIGLPTTIGVMLIALLLSLSLIFIGEMGIAQFDDVAERLLLGVDFNTTLMQGMLSFLLFAGALHVDLGDLKKQRWIVSTLATVGVLLSTLIVGSLTWIVLSALGIGMPFIFCLLFGALISPTDPIAVLSTLKSVGIAKSLETKIAGESLFNDGIGVVLFLVIAGLAVDPSAVSPGTALVLFSREAVGGLIFGLGLGYAGVFMLRTVDNYQVEILITLAMVMGGYAMALALHTSGPIAIVIAGLLIGNRGREHAMSERTREHLDTFWELVDEVLNAVLFVLIGLEVLVLEFSQQYLIAGLLMIPLVLLARTISVGVPVNLLKLKRDFSPHVVKILVWGGIRGGISVALALSLPPSSERDVIVAITYVIVVFSIIVQGLTIGKLAKRLGSIS